MNAADEIARAEKRFLEAVQNANPGLIEAGEPTATCRTFRSKDIARHMQKVWRKILKRAYLKSQEAKQ